MNSVHLLFGCLIFFMFLSCSEEKTTKKVLPFVGNYDLEYKLVDGKEIVDTIYPTVPYFYGLNQDSMMVTSKDLKGKVWIADFFFTTCPTICPTMTKNLRTLNENTRDLAKDVQFISFTINPDYDRPSILKRYREHYQITAKNWVFLSGKEEDIHELGINGFQIFAGKDDEAEGGYAHSGAFTLVDKEGYVRGVYLGTDIKQVEQLEKDLRLLLKEEYGIVGTK